MARPGHSGPARAGPGMCRVVLPYTPERVTQTDLAEIGGRLAALAPALELHPFAVSDPPAWLRSPPPVATVSLALNVVSVGRLLDRVPGPRFLGSWISKPAQLRRLDAAGVRVPRTAFLSPGLAVTRDRFGAFVLVKTTAPGSSRGRGIELVATDRFEAERRRLLERHAREIALGMPPLVQSYVPTGPRPTHVRVLCMGGRPILMYRTTAPSPFDAETSGTREPGAVTSNASDRRARRLDHCAETAAFGARAAAVFPQVPVLGVDVLRSSVTGRLYVLETNMGNIAPLSAPICSGLRCDLGPQRMLDQFGAYDVIAEGIAGFARRAGIALSAR